MRPPPPPPPVVALVWSIQKIRNTLCPLRHTYRPYRQFLTAGVTENSGEAELSFCCAAKKTTIDKEFSQQASMQRRLCTTLHASEWL
jgi:hypothetical protein